MAWGQCTTWKLWIVNSWVHNGEVSTVCCRCTRRSDRITRLSWRRYTTSGPDVSGTISRKRLKPNRRFSYRYVHAIKTGWFTFSHCEKRSHIFFFARSCSSRCSCRKGPDPPGGGGDTNPFFLLILPKTPTKFKKNTFCIQYSACRAFFG